MSAEQRVRETDTVRSKATAAGLAVLLASSGAAAAGHAQQDTARIGTSTIGRLQQIVNDAAIASGAVGVQVSVILGDRRADFVWGTANVELGTPMTAETVVQIGSVTKVFNAALVLTLVDEGRLSLDEPVRTYVPDLDLADAEAERTITLRQLLSMTSGLDNGPYTRHGGGDDALARYVASLGALPQAFAPGTAWGYSNAGTSVAGHAAERVTGRNWDVLLRQRILAPTGLTHSVTLPEELPYYRVSVGHVQRSDGKGPMVIRPLYLGANMARAQGPAGSTLTMSAHDLATFGQLFLRKGRAASGTRVLSEASVTTMMTPVVSVPSRTSGQGHWCVGFERDEWSGTPVFGHPGGNQSGGSYLKVLPERDGVLVVVVNTPAAQGSFSEKIFDAFGGAVFNATPAKPARPAAPVPLDNPERYTGTYVMMGTTYQVTIDHGALVMTVTGTPDHTTSMPEHPYWVGSATVHKLVPVRRDAFVMESSTGVAGGDVGFSGDDGRGRATILVAPYFPARRVR